MPQVTIGEIGRGRPAKLGADSAEIQNDDAAFGLVFFLFTLALARLRREGVDRKLQPGLIILTALLFFFATSNLVDDEGR